MVFAVMNVEGIIEKNMVCEMNQIEEEMNITSLNVNYECFDNGYCVYINAKLDTPINTYSLYDEDDFLIDVFMEKFKEKVNFNFDVNDVSNMCCNQMMKLIRDGLSN